MSAPVVAVTVVFATAAMQDAVPLLVPAGSTLADAVARSGLIDAHRLATRELAVAVFGKRRAWDARVHEGDRIELLRPLHADPKEARRHRAERDKRAPRRP